MMLPSNRFKRMLKDGRQQIGLWNSIPGSLTAELLDGRVGPNGGSLWFRINAA